VADADGRELDAPTSSQSPRPPSADADPRIRRPLAARVASSIGVPSETTTRMRRASVRPAAGRAPSSRLRRRCSLQDLFVEEEPECLPGPAPRHVGVLDDDVLERIQAPRVLGIAVGRPTGAPARRRPTRGW
jgi:hypothetical protein